MSTHPCDLIVLPMMCITLIHNNNKDLVFTKISMLKMQLRITERSWRTISSQPPILPNPNTKPNPKPQPWDILAKTKFLDIIYTDSTLPQPLDIDIISIKS